MRSAAQSPVIFQSYKDVTWLELQLCGIIEYLLCIMKWNCREPLMEPDDLCPSTPEMQIPTKNSYILIYISSCRFNDFVVHFGSLSLNVSLKEVVQ